VSTRIPAVSVLLASPLDDVLVEGRTIRRMAEQGLSGLRIVEPDQVPPEAVLVIHDPACPTVPASFVRQLVEVCGVTGRPQVAVLAVTDTIKVTDGDAVGETLDRDSLATVASPIVLPPGVRTQGRDVTGIVDELRRSHDLDLVEAPAGVVRLADGSDVAFLPGTT